MNKWRSKQKKSSSTGNRGKTARVFADRIRTAVIWIMAAALLLVMPGCSPDEVQFTKPEEKSLSEYMENELSAKLGISDLKSFKTYDYETNNYEYTVPDSTCGIVAYSVEDLDRDGRDDMPVITLEKDGSVGITVYEYDDRNIICETEKLKEDLKAAIPNCGELNVGIASGYIIAEMQFITPPGYSRYGTHVAIYRYNADALECVNYYLFYRVPGGIYCSDLANNKEFFSGDESDADEYVFESINNEVKGQLDRLGIRYSDCFTGWYGEGLFGLFIEFDSMETIFTTSNKTMDDNSESCVINGNLNSAQSDETEEQPEEDTEIVPNGTGSSVIYTEVKPVDALGESFSKEGTYYDDIGNKYNYSYHVPMLLINTQDAEKINKRIDSFMMEDINSELENMKGEFSLITYKAGYAAYTNDSVLSILLYKYTDYGWNDYETVNVDLSTGKELSNKEIFKLKGWDESDFLKAQKKALDKGYLKFTDGYELGSDDFMDEFYKEAYANTISSDNLSADTPIYLGKNGDLRFVGRLYSLGGADFYYHILSATKADGKIIYEEYKPVGKKVVYAAENSYISKVTTSGNLPAAGSRTYTGENTIDGDADTCWLVNNDVEGAAGAWIRYDFDRTCTVSGIKMINGNVYKDGYYYLNGHIKKFRLDFSDGTSITLTADEYETRDIDFNSFTFDKPVTTSYIKLTVVSSYIGTKESYRENTAMTEFEVF